MKAMMIAVALFPTLASASSVVCTEQNSPQPEKVTLHETAGDDTGVHADVTVVKNGYAVTYGATVYHHFTKVGSYSDYEFVMQDGSKASFSLSDQSDGTLTIGDSSVYFSCI
jgi:hypothetical protein